MRTILLPITAGLALLAIASGLSFRLVDTHLTKPYDVLHVPSGNTARLASLGHRLLVSDLYWLSAVQYIGDSKADSRGWEKLLPLIDLVTDLDPRHGYAYQTAGIVLSTAGRLGESDAILLKGMEKGPAWWTFPYYVAFNYWFYRGDLATAAKYGELAARQPGASPNISHLAVSLASKSGTPSDAVVLLQELIPTTHDDASRSRLEEQLRLATVERDAQRLERAAAELEQRRGTPIGSLRELVSSGVISSIPPDPFGGVYVWYGAERKVRSSVHPFRFEFRSRPHTPAFQYHPPDAQQERALR
jgi:hypothetical protein